MVTHYEVRCESLGAPVLRYQYVTVPSKRAEAAEYFEFLKTARTQLSELTKMEIMKVPEAKRSADCRRWLRGSMTLKWIHERLVEFPSTWAFYDDEIIRSFDDCWKQSQDQGKEGS
jgi:hypothetical protein